MRKKRILAVLLSSAIAFSGMPGNVFAAEDVALEDGFSDGGEITEDVTEESVEDVRESVPEIDQDAEDFAGFSDGESEDFVAEEELEDETDPETQVFADETETLSDVEIMSGKCGGRLYYKLIESGENVILCIEGSGDMYNYQVDSARGTLVPWLEYQDKITKLEISSEITSIGDYAFCDLSSLNQNIIIPNKVTVIGTGSFCGYRGTCEKLVIPDSVEEIKDYAFSNSPGIHGALVIGNNVKKIGKKAFFNCTGFEGDLIIPESVIKIRDNAFENCKNFTGKLVLPAKCELDYGVFKNCSGISGEVIIPSDFGTSYNGSQLYIPEKTFMGCTNITKVDIKGEKTNISGSAFAGCENLLEIKLANEMNFIGASSFEGCKKLEQIIIPSSCTTIGEKAFDNCPNLIISGIEDSYAKKFAEDNDIAFKSITVTIENQYYTGEKVEPTVKIMLGDRKLILGEDYTVNYYDNINVGTATAVVEGNGIFACKMSFNFEIVEKEHKWTDWEIIKEATCTIAGEKRRECSLCGEIDTEKIPETGHTIVIDPALEATCEESGRTEGSHCSVCGEVLIEQESTAIKEHSWGEWKVVKEATVTSEGEEQRACTRCGKVEKSSIPEISPSATPSAVPTEVPKPTSTPTPIATPIPIATPEPSITPVPTNESMKLFL